MKTETIWYLIAFSIQITCCVLHCVGIYRYNKKWKDEYLRGFDEGCKWTVEEFRRLSKKDE